MDVLFLTLCMLFLSMADIFCPWHTQKSVILCYDFDSVRAFFDSVHAFFVHGHDNFDSVHAFFVHGHDNFDSVHAFFVHNIILLLTIVATK